MKKFYTRAIDYLETLDIDPEQADQDKKGWKQIKMMFTREDRQALLTMIDNNTTTQADQCTPVQALKAIQTTIKDEEHYWHYQDEIMCNIRQEPQEQVHALNTRITTLVTNCKFPDQQTTETMKIMLLQHAIRYHKAQDWIRLQEPATLTYKSLSNHCKQLEQCCKQFKKAQLMGRAELTSLTVTFTRTSVQQDSISTHPKQTNCYRCGYSHTNRDCPAIGQRCHKCKGMNHFSALCRSRNYRDYRDYDRQSRHSQREPHKSRNSSRSSSHDSSRSNSRSKHHKSPQHSNRYRRSPTPFTIHSIMTSVQKSAEAANTDSEDKPISKCKDRHPTPLLFNFSNLDSSTCDELAFSDTEVCTNYRFSTFTRPYKPPSRTIIHYRSQ